MQKFELSCNEHTNNMQGDIIAALHILTSRSVVCKYLQALGKDWIIYGGFIRYLATTITRDGIDPVDPKQPLHDPFNYHKSLSRIIYNMPADVDIMVMNYANIPFIDKMADLKSDSKLGISSFEKVSTFQTRYGIFHRWKIVEFMDIGNYGTKFVEFEISLCEHYKDVYDFTVNTLAFNPVYHPSLFSSLSFNPDRMQFTVDEIINDCKAMALVPLYDYDEPGFESIGKRMKKLNSHGYQCNTVVNDETTKKNDSLEYKLTLIVAQAKQFQLNLH